LCTDYFHLHSSSHMLSTPSPLSYWYQTPFLQRGPVHPLFFNFPKTKQNKRLYFCLR
jgi:hypothetical protein